MDLYCQWTYIWRGEADCACSPHAIRRPQSWRLFASSRLGGGCSKHSPPRRKALEVYLDSQVLLERLGACLGHSMVLLARAATHAYGANHLALPFEWNAARKDHDPSIVGRMNPEKLSAGLRVCRQILRGNVEGARRKSLFDGNINATNPRPIHAHVSDQVASRVGDRDVHGLANFLGLLLSSSNDFSCIVKGDHEKPPGSP